MIDEEQMEMWNDYPSSVKVKDTMDEDYEGYLRDGEYEQYRKDTMSLNEFQRDVVQYGVSKLGYDPDVDGYVKDSLLSVVRYCHYVDVDLSDIAAELLEELGAEDE